MTTVSTRNWWGLTSLILIPLYTLTGLTAWSPTHPESGSRAVLERGVQVQDNEGLRADGGNTDRPVDDSRTSRPGRTTTSDTPPPRSQTREQPTRREAPRREEADGASRARWPYAPGRRSQRPDARGFSATRVGPPVPEELAFEALRRVGSDPAAERTWLEAIHHPMTPPGLRSDLIEDLNEQGYTDNSHPTIDDLPLILERLELIERHLPYETDEVNRAAFEEAYKDLLAMAERLRREAEGR
jgi:hypothetical protein